MESRPVAARDRLDGWGLIELVPGVECQGLAAHREIIVVAVRQPLQKREIGLVVLRHPRELQIQRGRRPAYAEAVARRDYFRHLQERLILIARRERRPPRRRGTRAGSLDMKAIAAGPAL